MSDAFRESIYNYLVNDAGLMALCGGEVRLYHRLAGENPQMPYLVYLLDENLQDDNISMEGSLIIDTWDHSPSVTRATQIAKHIKLLLHNHYDPGLNGAALFFRDASPVRTDHPEVQRVTSRFGAYWPDLDLAQYVG